MNDEIIQGLLFIIAMGTTFSAIALQGINNGLSKITTALNMHNELKYKEVNDQRLKDKGL